MKRSLLLLSALLVADGIVGQCELVGVPGGTVGDANAPIDFCHRWDPDGAGPLPEHIVFGGRFTQIGEVTSAGLALYNPISQEFSTIGSFSWMNFTGRVTAITVMPNNDLVVAGRFTMAGGVQADNIARWDGTSWHAIGGGISNGADAMVVMPNGDLVVGGLGPWTGSQVQRFDGTQWASLGAPITGAVSAMAMTPTGELLVGGTNLMPNAIALVSWDGSAWSVFPGNIEGTVRDMELLPSGDLVISGLITMAAGVQVNHIAKWDGSSWSGFGSGLSSFTTAMTVVSNGDILVGGDFQTAGGVAANRIARWDGTQWLAMGNGLGQAASAGQAFPVACLVELPNGDIAAGGMFRLASGNSDHLRSFDGTAWRPIRPSTTGLLYDSAVLSGGDRIVVGEFDSIEGVAANHIAREAVGGWQALGAGADGPVFAVLELTNGDVVVGGDFTRVGGVAADHVARWDGSSWHAIGAGLHGIVRDLVEGPAGELLAAGDFLDQIAVFDGTAWNGTGIISLSLGNASLLADDGAVYASIQSLNFDGICEWDGFGWVQISTQLPLVGPLARLANGDFVSTSSGDVWAWDGAAWSQLGNWTYGNVYSMVALPDGGLLVGGSIQYGGGLDYLLRWDGSTWTPLDAGSLSRIYHLSWVDDGRVFVGGEFTRLLSEPIAAFGYIAAPCPGSVTANGTGCANTMLEASNLPWLGGTFVSEATGLPASSIVAEVYGLASTMTPLANVLSQAGAGCTLLAMPDFVRIQLPTAPGEVELQFEIPNASVLLSTVFHQQVIPFELDPQANIVAITASNALQLTIGKF